MSTVIPDPLPQPSFRLPHPSFRRKPESMAYGHIHRHPDSPSRHPGASRNLWRAVIFTVIPTPPAVIPAQAGIYGVRSYSPSFRIPSPTRHSGASRNLSRAVIFTVIPDPLPQPSFRRKPESTLAAPSSRHTGASRNLSLPPPLTVIPSQARIYPCRLPPPSFRRKPE